MHTHGDGTDLTPRTLIELGEKASPGEVFGDYPGTEIVFSYILPAASIAQGCAHYPRASKFSLYIGDGIYSPSKVCPSRARCREGCRPF